MLRQYFVYETSVLIINTVFILYSILLWNLIVFSEQSEKLVLQ